MATKTIKYKGVSILTWKYAGSRYYRPVRHNTRNFKSLKAAKKFIDKS